MSSERFSYEAWNTLLPQIVTADGKVDYELLADRRALLDRFVADLAAASPDSDAARFPTDDDALAYWINAYNAFTLHAVMAEYPISSVWKTRDGQFFRQKRHVAGGAAVSLDDVEHQVLRGKFAEPRIHFAINCGSNGCPVLRPAAYEGGGLQDALRTATEQFLGSEWNCKVDHASRRVAISRIFKIYAEDFSGAGGSTSDYKAGVLAFVARHTGVPLEAIADYELVYNTYDWGLNDARRTAKIGPVRLHEPSEHFAEGDTVLRELHVYEGSFCNRACSWCTINGSPEGYYEPYSYAVLDQALATLAPDGNLKFYGGEPTLHHHDVIAAMRYVRERGFRGIITVFSNGIKASHLIEVLESDARSDAVLNYSIWHGRDAEPIPAASRARIEAWAERNPHRVFQGFKLLFQAGAGAGQAFEKDRTAEFHGMGGECMRCFPVLTTRGQLHACPFAAEVNAPHYDLGRVGSDPGEVFRNYRAFRQWTVDVLDPAAREKNVTSCQMCHAHLAELEPPVYERGPARPAGTGSLPIVK